ncbi:hypothetical protein DFH08DRAFT_491014 [Mycena albidolilacea]|uniref:Uncharacterized protein n=1 Tax=Mycena albidolilacea TaxID=1033008 RepID=A0AAD6Z5X2_9AGAR|nr:hypothetical protein DFH08DRAFT_491014 [Mycena albidolilacea]
MSQPQRSLSDNCGVTYDDMYIKILSRNSQALLILRMVSIWPVNLDPWAAALDLLELQWNEIRPLAALRSYCSNGMSLSQSLFTFLHDPIRSRALYATRQEIYDLATMHCISRIRKALVDVNGFLFLRYVLPIEWSPSCTPNRSAGWTTC